MSNHSKGQEIYKKGADFVPLFGKPVIKLLEPKMGEKILDLGCGDGTFTKELADMGCDVLGVDSSPEMVEATRSLGL